MGFWGWVIAAVVAVGVVAALRTLVGQWLREAPVAKPRPPYVPDEQRCEEPVDDGDERCPYRATSRWGNRRVCDEHLRYHQSWQG